jgi:hypothetical protein
VRGARGGKFESLHPLRSSVGWSPDGRYLVAAAQKGARDALYVLDAATGRTLRELTPDLDAVERPDWSPAAARFVFTGMKGGQADLWAMDADGTRLERLTDDLAREEAPRFSPDGRRIAFSSDTAESTGTDLWVLDVATGARRPLRIAPGDQWDPCWSADGGTVYHVSDERGTRDLMAVPAAGGAARRLTALIGGADAPTAARTGSRLVFTAFHEGGWDLVLVEDPDTLDVGAVEPVRLCAVPWQGHTPPDERAAASGDAAPEAERDEHAAPEADPASAAEADAEPEPGDRAAPPPRVIAYHPHFRSEWITGAFFYDGFGASAALQSSVSDVLGNHRFYVGANVFRSLENTDAFLTYSYLPRRLDWSFGVYHAKDLFLDDRTGLGQPLGEEGHDAYFSERRWGTFASVTYPFHTFRRIGLEVNALEIDREILDEEEDVDADAVRFRGRVVLPRIYHSFDNTLWGWTGPVQGSRSLVSFQHSLPVGGDRLSFGTALADARWYARFAGDYVVAIRGFVASSFGSDPQQFQIGGPNSVRGHPRQAYHGRNAALATVEFRYPFIEYVKLGWPFRSAFGGIRGDVFLDVGTAFDDPRRFRAVGRGEDGRAGLEDVHVGFGVGARARVAYFPLRVDVGWPADGPGVGSPVWHVTVAPEF